MDFSSSSDNVGADSNSSKDIVCKSDSGARLVNDRGMLDVDCIHLCKEQLHPYSVAKQSNKADYIGYCIRSGKGHYQVNIVFAKSHRMEAAEAVRGSELVSDRFMQVTGRGIDKCSLLCVVEFVRIAFAFLL